LLWHNLSGRFAVMGKKKGGKKKRKAAGGELPISAVSFTGSIFDVSESGQNDAHTVAMTFAQNIASTAGGVINDVFGNDPSSCNDWTSLAAVFGEYRVLGTMFEFYPQNKYSKSVVITRPVAVVVDRSTSTPLTSYAAAADFSSFHMASMDDELKRGSRDHPPVIARMSSTDEAAFRSTSSNVSTWWTKLYGDGLSASTTYGVNFVTYRVQFRARK